MELEEVLKAKGVTTLEELEAKIKADAKKEADAAEVTLRKQIKDLEAIKDSQGQTIGDARKEADLLKARLLEIEKEKMKPISENRSDDAQAPNEEQLRRANEAREQALTDEQWLLLEEATKVMDTETRKLAVATEEGRAAFMNSVLGSAQTAQETFRRPVQQKKLTVQEQIEIALGKTKANVPPALRPAGSGFSADRQPVQKPAAPSVALLRNGGLRDMIAANKQG